MKKFKVTLNGKSYEVDVEIMQDDTPATSYMPMMPSPVAAPPMAVPTPAAVKSAAPTSGSSTLNAPMNGVVIEIPVKVGDVVKTGQLVVILEAMKMKTNVASDRDGKISAINISPNDSVEAGQVMLTFA